MTSPMDVDPDHAHLYRLLCMLPAANCLDFWTAVAEANHTSVGYVFEKMSNAARFVHAPKPGPDFADFCVYLVNFFGGDKPEIWEEFHNQLNGDDRYGLGRIFADDLARTAWKLWVRYRPVSFDSIQSWHDAHFSRGK